MADLKISELSALAGGDLVAADELAIVDDSASETKKITVSNLIANGVTLISDDSIPGAKILFGAGDIATAALADSAVTALKIANDAVTAAKIADNVIVDLVSELPASGDYTGQLALDTDDNSLYVWSGTAWLNTKAPASVNAFTDTSAGIINITTSVSGGTATVTASIDDTTAAAQFLAGPVGSAGTVGYRAIDGGDLPTATTTAKGGVVVNGNGLVMDGSTIEIDNSVTASSVSHLVTYDAKGLITGGRVIASSDLPVATTSAKGAVLIGSTGGLTVNASGNVSINNDVTSGTYTKVTVTAKGVVSAGDTLDADDIPDHSAAKLTSGTIGSSLIANGAITASKMADQSTVKFGGALGSDNVTIFPAGDFKGQLFWDETSEDLYIYSGSAFIPITVLSGNLVNAGAYDASTNTMSSVTTAGSSAGFSAGAALPAPAAGNLNHYVVVDTSGTGSGAAPAVALAPPDMLLSQGVGTEYALIDVSNAIAGQTASNISVIASGNIAATDVQAALQEVDSEKLQKSGDTMTGALGIGTASSIVFEGSTADDYETTLTVTDPTADRTITLPNVTGTVVTTGDTGSVTSTMIANGTIANADISSSAEIAVSKLANGTARQLLQTDSGGTGVEFTSNVDVPGTLDVTNAATFDSTVTATGLITANGKVSFPAGTAAAPSLYSGSDTDTGIYSPGSDQFGITTGGTSRVVVNSSGNVGIGTTSNYDDSVLEVRKASGGDGVAIRVTNDATTNGSLAGVIFTNSTSDFTSSAIAHKRNDNALIFFNGQTAGGGGFANAIEAMRLDSSNRLLVGTSSNTLSNASVVIRGNPAASGVDGVIQLSRDSLPNATTSGVGTIFFTDNSSNIGARIGGVADAAWTSGTSHPTRLVFSTTADGASSPAERMRISSNGQIYTGAATPGASAFGFSINRNGLQGLLECYRNVGNNSQTAIIGGNAGEAYIEGDGDLKNTNNSYGAISDIKLKENIVDASSQWGDLKALQVRNYNFKPETGYNDHTQIGLVAQEVELVSPGLVSESPDVDEEGNDLGTVTKSVNYSVLYMKAVKALQEAMERIETLEQRLSDAGIA